MIKLYLLLLFTFLLPSILWGQKKPDTTSLLHAFKSGKTSGHFRTFFMTTNNDGPLTDYYALVFGGGIKYQTKNFKGFQSGVGGFFTRNITSSDLTEPDNITNMMNRYEIGQFDQANISNKKDLQRLEDFYIKYNFKNSFLKFGKQIIKTPFINPQDGRMWPTGEQGFWLEMNEIKKTKLEIGWLTHISPRGTVKWYSASSSIGIYPTGVNIDGNKSEYKNNLRSKGIGIAGLSYAVNKNLKLQAWETLVENIFNTILLQADGSFTFNNKNIISGSFQYIHQDPIRQGGNPENTKTYFDPSQKMNAFGISIGYHQKHSVIKINYSRITDDGRFLFPREWGREPLFTFLARERNEGSGDVNAFTINAEKRLFSQKFILELGGGYYDLPDVKDYRLNKYGMPSYFQFNFDTKYSFDGFMQGLNLELLYLYKARKGNIYSDWKFVINKVNMHQLNVILNYNF
jgi:hypothetical protein